MSQKFVFDRNSYLKVLVFSLFMLNYLAAWAQPGKVYKSLNEVNDPADVYRLQLRGKRLKHIPAAVYEMTNLQELDLRGNRIVQLPDSIALLTHLQRLVLSRNPLTGVPAAIAKMDELRELVLWSTYVTELPPEIERLDTTLELLDLRDCPLTEADQKAIEQMLPSVKKLWYYACNCN